jgi:hypothetical protein
MAGGKVNYLTMALKRLKAARVSQLLCFSPTPSCVDVAPSSLQGQHAGGVAAGLNCVLAITHGVSSPKKI